MHSFTRYSVSCVLQNYFLSTNMIFRVWHWNLLDSGHALHFPCHIQILFFWQHPGLFESLKCCISGIALCSQNSLSYQVGVKPGQRTPVGSFLICDLAAVSFFKSCLDFSPWFCITCIVNDKVSLSFFFLMVRNKTCSSEGQRIRLWLLC